MAVDCSIPWHILPTSHPQTHPVKQSHTQIVGESFLTNLGSVFDKSWTDQTFDLTIYKQSWTGFFAIFFQVSTIKSTLQLAEWPSLSNGA
jgi:hypothetical protein